MWNQRLPKIMQIYTDNFFTLWKSRQLGCLRRRGWGIWLDKYGPREQQRKRGRSWIRSARTFAQRLGKRIACGDVVTSPNYCIFICWGLYQNINYYLFGIIKRICLPRRYVNDISGIQRISVNWNVWSSSLRLDSPTNESVTWGPCCC